MIACQIKKVEPVTGLIPSLRFTTNIRIDDPHTDARLFVAKWIGEIGFTKSQEPTNGMSPTGPNKLVLPARWSSEPHATRSWARSDTAATFECDVPPAVVDAIDRFRDGGRLFARVQGKLQIWPTGSPGTDVNEVLSNILGGITDPMRIIWFDIWGDSIELTHHVWCEEILPALRPPGRVVFEAVLPPSTPTEEHGRRALDHLDAAQRAFDEGRYEESARLVYKAGEALQPLGKAVESRYSEYTQRRVAEANSAIQALANSDRHDATKGGGRHDTDRLMAQHLITSMKSLAAVYLAGRTT